MSQRWKEISDLVQWAIDSGVVRRAVSSGRYYREVFVSAPIEGILVEGFLDLLFEEADGLVIVDYKTDSLSGEDEIRQTTERYRIHGGAYALALDPSSGRPAKEVVFLFLQPREEVVLKDMSMLHDEAGRSILAVIDSD